MSGTPIGAAGATEAPVDADTAGCDGETDAVPVMPAVDGVAAGMAVTGATPEAEAGTGAVEPRAVPTNGDAAAAEAVGAAANG